MLVCKHVTIEDQKQHILLENFQYSLGDHEHLAIIGEEGNGKSTLLKAIYHQGLHEEYVLMRGQIETDAQHIGYFKQQIEANWQELSVYEYLLKNEVNEEIPWERYNDLATFENLASELHMPVEIVHSDQRVKTLSGGEKVKLQLLKIMYSPCDILLLDEPTNDLDIETLQWLEAFIKNNTMAIIFVSHDETLLNNAADVIFHMEQLNKKSKSRYTIYRGKYEDYIATRKESLQKELQLAHKEKIEYQKKMIKLNDVKNAVHDALNDTVRNPGLAAKLKGKMRNIKAQEQRFEDQRYHHVDSVEEAIDVYFNDVKQYHNKQILQLHNEDIEIEGKHLIHIDELLVKGKDKVVITGRNGCGKSLLIKQIYEKLNGKEGINVGYMPQNYQECFQKQQTSIDFLLDERDQADITIARSLLGRMKFTTEEMEHDIHTLSEGQKAKLYLLKFIKCKCDVLLLDEPTRNLSPLTNPVIRAILQAYTGCIIAISHDRLFVKEIATRQINVIQHKLIEVSK